MAATGQAGLTGVDIQGMKALLPDFEKTLSDTKTAINRMTDQRQTLAASWTGDAASGYISSLDQWLEQLQQVQTQLQWVTETFQSNTNSYEQVHGNTVDTAHAMSQAVSAGLPGF
ncbi:WXG100 family type VII secretion target [Streptomyces sp. 8L]|uniref:WXG100 family type VII secretion target n=1 Tax=Streptomyces sp. 8L TaxID=2877242 RepID=UPI001CD78B0C|nr:WXG100 family type VII secretion target [Streptomyces sp. 8L]MCA1217015.1 WXG100 family type VII secretion target [Streptomyces sp. 8L]